MIRNLSRCLSFNRENTVATLASLFLLFSVLLIDAIYFQDFMENPGFLRRDEIGNPSFFLEITFTYKNFCIKGLCKTF